MSATMVLLFPTTGAIRASQTIQAGLYRRPAFKVVQAAIELLVFADRGEPMPPKSVRLLVQLCFVVNIDLSPGFGASPIGFGAQPIEQRWKSFVTDLQDASWFRGRLSSSRRHFPALAVRETRTYSVCCTVGRGSESSIPISTALARTIQV